MEDKKTPRWVVDPHGHIVKLSGREPWKATLKDGWRDADENDFAIAAAAEAARQKAESEEAKSKLEALRAAQEEPAAHGGPLKAE